MPHEIISLPPLEPARGYSFAHGSLYLGCSIPSVYQEVKAGRLATRKLGKRRIIPGSELIRFLAGEPPVMKGDPIEPRMSALGRTGGLAGGLAKARKFAANASSREKART